MTSKPPQDSEQAPGARRSWADLLPRLLSAGILLAITITAVALGDIWFALLLSAVFAGIYREWEMMVNGGRFDTRAIILAVLLGGAPLVMVVGGLWSGGLLTIAALAAIFSGRRDVAVWRAGGFAFFVLVIAALMAIRGTSLLGFAACFFLGATVWMTDTGAFFAGRLIGGAKLSPEISPAKTWSGALGGLILGTLSGLLVWVSVTSAPWWIGLAIAMGISLAGQAGDLTESAIKRWFRIKDTSDLIPGHGGLMDRMDSLTFGALIVLAVGVQHSGLEEVAQGLLIW